MNSATPSDTGTASTSAITAVNSVPKMNGSAPKMPSGADHRLDEKNSGPISLTTGTARFVITIAMRPSATSTSIAAPTDSQRNARSGVSPRPTSTRPASTGPYHKSPAQPAS